ncbi:dual 3',5'-cyclic-AMP and -GMP phosphodiesterase 11 isoform X3 [Nilaparvata lugens]|uniref:dual 3',5'-cyclic-AMP and -GMP phosphodiesterase 11 isoform X3 n=2 Tax=Nilaparvata lugens TaxID=108931 RepID=UPI00193E321A|nr:dual 3',5'-cyclic-AMP and -GMP phosphodiesterase 11 isoform X3 [Nilaparvata lugens]
MLHDLTRPFTYKPIFVVSSDSLWTRSYGTVIPDVVIRERLRISLAQRVENFNGYRNLMGLHVRSGDEQVRMTAETMPVAPPPGAEAGAGGAGGGHCQYYDPEYARMEAWLDEHPEFVEDYFIRKATRQVVDAWLISHATPTGSSSGGCCELGSPVQAPCPASRASSGATTPVRKISAHEFERGGLLKPIVNTIDGTPTFLSVTPAGEVGGVSTTSNANSTASRERAQRRSRNDLRHLDEKELIFELVKDICNELDVRSLCHKILQNVSTLLHADRGSLFLVQGEREQQQPSAAPNNNNNNNNMEQPKAAIVPSTVASQHNSNNNSNSSSISSVSINNHVNRPAAAAPVGCISIEEQRNCPRSSPPPATTASLNAVVGCIGSTNTGSLPAPGSTPASRHHQHHHPSAASEGCQPSRCLVSKLFDVCSRSTLQEMEKKEEIRIPWGMGIVGFVAESGQPVNIPDAYKDERFNHDIDVRTGYKTRTLLCMPIKDINGEVIGVAQVINKFGDSSFTVNDEKVFSSYLQFCGIGLRNAQLYEKSLLEVKRNQVLLDLARMIFEEQSTIEHMVFRILTHTQSLIQCHRVQVLLLHKASKGSFSRVFDFQASDLESSATEERTSPFESRFPINIGITGYVATTGETVNIVDAYKDQRFDPSVDVETNFRHRSILCMPIKNSSGQIIGVIQLINKFEDLPFTKNDENFVEAFAIFCGMGIHNTHMYEKAVIAMAKQSVTLDVLSYHASASLEDAQRLRKMRVPSSATFMLHDFKFDDLRLSDDDTLKACLRMFLDLDFVERFHIDYEVLCRWLLSVRKNYRNVTYHNWRHAFNVAQMMFSIITTTQWWKIFGELECMALIIACLCHDLDHRGTNNSFQIKASSPLAQLYSTSTMEHHHFDQCIMILNSQGNQILSNLSPDEYSRVIKVLEDAILSTDLAVYFTKRGMFLNLVRERSYNWSREDHRELLRGMTMTVCDLAAITKPWNVEKRIAELVTSEFFEQGDIERQELNITPIDIMNREKEDQLPAMQVDFIDSICLPIYESFAELSEKLRPLVQGVLVNRKHWEKIALENNQKRNDHQMEEDDS